MIERLLVFGMGMVGMAFGDGPADNLAENVRRIPPLGIEVPDEVRGELQEGLKALMGAMKKVEKDERLADVEIFYKAVAWVLRDGEFRSEKEFEVARNLLKVGLERVAALTRGEAPWTRETGLVVRGYRSAIDGSVQPYGLEIPEGYDFDGVDERRLDFWFHGRAEKVSELGFIQQRMTKAGQYPPGEAIVLHPWGRYSNANKFAGEVDLFEAWEHAKRDYRIDEDRVVVRGFSMGGAACWQFAVHYAGLWAAANPGAGFSETRKFLDFFQGEDVSGAPWYQKKLWRWYDCDDWVTNLLHVPTVAYSGEMDKQKQAADVMEDAMEAEGMNLVHVIGAKMGHKIDAASKAVIEEKVSAVAAVGRDRVPSRVRFTTYTLRYPEMLWVRVEGMGEHWEKATVEARIVPGSRVVVETENVTVLRLKMGAGECPLDMAGGTVVVIDGVELDGGRVMSDRSWEVVYTKEDGSWRSGEPGDGARKKPGLQGPIDDAFMGSFVMVRPTGEALHAATGRWAEVEMAHAVEHWRRQFRGEARVVDDGKLSEAMVADMNLVLWGDPGSNSVLARVVGALPIEWSADGLVVNGKRYEAGSHVPVLVFPNPLNPERYVVVNSGFTYREYDYLNNARQVAKLPDWAVVDVRGEVTSRVAGRVVVAGFFGEGWELRPE
ncbi:MAG: prolyl oligopeptidase family serine peptidase [Verrucomicrobiales bacterium]|nr:prolyl oligopeptidase family serine peptidase [Verrucomicrobiales bacterium]